MPKISIITTTYNHSKYIWETIESILNQTFIDWELLVWDDNSPDNTYEIASQYSKKDKRIRVWKHKENVWIVWNLQFLINKTSEVSEYIAFLEWDDIYIKSHLEKKIQMFSKYEEIALVYNNLDFIDKDTKIFYKNFLKKTPFYLKNQKLEKEQFIKNERFYGSYSSLMIKKEILLKEKINNPTTDKLFTVSDWDLFFRISTKYNTYGIEESLTLYRRHAGNLSYQHLKLFQDLQLQLDIYKYSWFINEKLYKFKTSYVHVLKSVAYIQRWERKDSLFHFFRSFKYSFFSYFLYKIAIAIMLILPLKVTQFIIWKVVKR